MISKDPYKILGVSPTASDAEIKSAYKELVKKYHPDQYQDNPLADVAEEKMSEINAAYDQIMTSRRGGGAPIIPQEAAMMAMPLHRALTQTISEALSKAEATLRQTRCLIMCPPRKEMPSGIFLKALSVTVEAGSTRHTITSQEPSSSTLAIWSIKVCWHK